MNIVAIRSCEKFTQHSFYCGAPCRCLQFQVHGLPIYTMTSTFFPLILGGKLALTPMATTAVHGFELRVCFEFSCVHFSRLFNKQSTKETVNQPALHNQHTPLYEAVLPKIMKHEESLDLELKENEAYGSVH